MAGKRIGWDNLSANQRKRYISKGITKRDYDSGVSLKAGRGHATTPERPSQAARRPADYVDYRKRQQAKAARTEAQKDSRRIRDDFKRTIEHINSVTPAGERLDVSEVLAVIKSSKDRADFVAGWQIANKEWQGSKVYDKRGRQISGSGSYGRQRLDELESAYPELEKAIGYYH